MEKAKENAAATAAVLSEEKINGVNLNLDALIQDISNMAEDSRFKSKTDLRLHYT